MNGKDGKPYRAGGVWIRRVAPQAWTPKPVDRRPDWPISAGWTPDQQDIARAGARAVINIISLPRADIRTLLRAQGRKHHRARTSS